MSHMIYLLGRDVLVKTLDRILTSFGLSCTTETPGKLTGGVAVIVYSGRESADFFKSVAGTWKLNLEKRIIGFCIDPVPEFPDECKKMSPAAQRAFSKTFLQITGLNIAELLEILKTPASESDALGELKYYHSIILQSAWSYNLYNLIYRKIAHGTKLDFSNTYLAPAMAGLQLAENEQKIYFNELKRNLCPPAGKCDQCTKLCPLKSINVLLKEQNISGGFYAQELKEYIDVLYNAPWDYENDNYKKVLFELSEFNATIRRQSGMPVLQPYYAGTNIQQTQNLQPAGAGDKSILLIDDHALYWRPFFSRIASELQCKIYFSLDGKSVCMDKGVEKDVDFYLPFFDVIILDIIIGDKKNGLDILANIRKSLPNMPIVITSTTLEPDLAVSMRCANGFIYKKQINFEKTAALLSDLLKDGCAGQSLSIPNVFFSYNITGEAREPVLNFTNWTIKHLDGFHAIDDEYFKYFNDHGGRHMISLMGILERLLKPFLFATEDLLGIANSEKDENIICLYLAVLCHEFGMFPLYTASGSGTSLENYRSEEFKKGFPAGDFENVYSAIRKFHGQRSMFMLMDDNLQYPEFRTIFLNILQCFKGREEVVRCKVAALCGYHNRFLSLRYRDFLQEIGTQSPKLKQIKNTILGTLLTRDNFVNLFFKKTAFWEEEKKEILRRQCAVFRFADALDIDSSRAIPAYLGYNDNQNNYIENFKRYIVKTIDIIFGEVIICFNLSELEEKFNIANTHVFWEKVESQEEYILKIDNEPIPVAPDGGKAPEEYILKIDNKPIAELTDKKLKVISNAVTKEFKTLLADVSKKKELKNLLCHPAIGGDSCSKTKELKNLLCLMVMLELADEYKAVRDVNLQHIIKIGKGCFRKSSDGFDFLDAYFRSIT